MKTKKQLALFLLVFAIFLTLPILAHADMGPKPSVEITFTGAPDTVYYVTLLSQNPSTGPQSVYDPNEGNDRLYDEVNRSVWQKFVDYADPDGFYFLQVFDECHEKNSFRWGYYPPKTFKILVYFPDTDRFVSSGIYETYAFDSYYTMPLDTAGTPEATRSYDYTAEIFSLVVRIVATIAVEVALAYFVFRLSSRERLRFILLMNVVTQILLNLALNVVNYRLGSLNFVIFYVFFEFLVFAVEAIAYLLVLPRLPGKPLKRFALPFYALAANVLSFAVGLMLAHIIPGIF